jgi:hypothetical protein
MYLGQKMFELTVWCLPRRKIQVYANPLAAGTGSWLAWSPACHFSVVVSGSEVGGARGRRAKVQLATEKGTAAGLLGGRNPAPAFATVSAPMFGHSVDKASKYWTDEAGRQTARFRTSTRPSQSGESGSKHHLGSPSKTFTFCQIPVN